jgi:hypothetical protein
MNESERRIRSTADRDEGRSEPASTGDSRAAIDYVRRVCETKGSTGEPALDENEYVRYVTVGRHKRAPVARRHRSGDRLDEVF